MNARIEEALSRLATTLQGVDGEAFIWLVLEAKRLKEENERLHTRLEDNYCWQTVNGKWVKIAVEPGSIPDGIECRDETIRLLQERMKS